MARAILLVLLLACLGTSRAQEETELTRREALVRQQQSDEFALRLEQAQRELQAATPAERRNLEAFHEEQRRRIDVLRDQGERRTETMRARSGVPSWGPTLDAPRPHTPTLERPRRPWTPTLD